mgnify:CR=1 FL=1
MREYFEKTLGVPSKNIYYKTNSDVSQAEFSKVFSEGGWLDKRIKDGQSDVFVYYAGHGLVNSETGEGFWLPVDADQEDESNWLLTDRIRSKIKVMPAKHVLVVADSCFSGKFTRSMTRGFTISPDATDYVPALQRLVGKRSRTVLTSGGLEPVLDSIGNSKHSVFANAFLSILGSNEKVLDGARLFQKIRFNVINNSSQTPEYSPIPEGGHDGGDFLFVRRY